MRKVLTVLAVLVVLVLIVVGIMQWQRPSGEKPIPPITQPPTAEQPEWCPDVEVVAADGKVFAQLPFTTEFVEVDPADYAAPDPAALMEPEGGLSSLLTAAEGVEAGEQVRHMQEAMASRAVIEQAKGMVMAAQGCDADEAFDELRRLASGSRRKVRVVAEEVVAARGRTLPARD